MQIRVNAESMAFYQSGMTELFKTNTKLFDLLEVQYKLAQRKYALTCQYKINYFHLLFLWYCIDREALLR